MKIICALLVLFVVSPALADEAPDYPNEVTESIFIGSSIAVSLVNAFGLVTTEPSYWLGGIGIGVGGTTLALMSAETTRYEEGLAIAGTVSVAVGFITMLQRRFLGTRHGHLEPTSSNGSTGFALVLDF
jgi:hypothetical protein